MCCKITACQYSIMCMYAQTYHTIHFAMYGHNFAMCLIDVATCMSHLNLCVCVCTHNQHTMSIIHWWCLIHKQQFNTSLNKQNISQSPTTHIQHVSAIQSISQSSQIPSNTIRHTRGNLSTCVSSMPCLCTLSHIRHHQSTIMHINTYIVNIHNIHIKHLSHINSRLTIIHSQTHIT